MYTHAFKDNEHNVVVVVVVVVVVILFLTEYNNTIQYAWLT